MPPGPYCLKVTLRDSVPLIWRKIVVAADVTLFDLHLILQATMGWHNDHMYEFVIARKKYGYPDNIPFFGTKAATNVNLYQVVLKPGTKFIYEYDFGDDWKYDIILEDILPDSYPLPHPICLDGQRACPPEDCGGIFSYMTMLPVLADPKHPQYKDLRQWLGTRSNPATFNKSTVNAKLKQVIDDSSILF
jgi:hypothetical protein